MRHESLVVLRLLLLLAYAAAQEAAVDQYDLELRVKAKLPEFPDRRSPWPAHSARGSPGTAHPNTRTFQPRTSAKPSSARRHVAAPMKPTAGG